MLGLIEQVLPYLKAEVHDDDGQTIELDAASSPVLVPFIGSLLVSYVVDEGQELRFVTEGERERSGISHEELRRAAVANLKARVQSTGVRLVPYGKILGVLFGGNFEATLLLWDDLAACARDQLGPELLAAAPARDILAISSPGGVDELRAIISRTWPGGDHLLTPDIYRHTKGGWSVCPPS
jgi:hypothetical protein